MSPQIVRAWLRGDVRPAKATREGAVMLLSRPNSGDQPRADDGLPPKK